MKRLRKDVAKDRRKMEEEKMVLELNKHALEVKVVSTTVHRRTTGMLCVCAYRQLSFSVSPS